MGEVPRRGSLSFKGAANAIISITPKANRKKSVLANTGEGNQLAELTNRCIEMPGDCVDATTELCHMLNTMDPTQTADYLEFTLKPYVKSKSSRTSLSAMRLIEILVNSTERNFHDSIMTKKWMERLQKIVKNNVDVELRRSIVELLVKWRDQFRDEPRYALEIRKALEKLVQAGVSVPLVSRTYDRMVRRPSQIGDKGGSGGYEADFVSEEELRPQLMSLSKDMVELKKIIEDEEALKKYDMPSIISECNNWMAYVESLIAYEPPDELKVELTRINAALKHLMGMWKKRINAGEPAPTDIPHKIGSAAAANGSSSAGPSAADLEQMKRLEAELQAARDQLQSSAYEKKKLMEQMEVMKSVGPALESSNGGGGGDASSAEVEEWRSKYQQAEMNLAGMRADMERLGQEKVALEEREASIKAEIESLKASNQDVIAGAIEEERAKMMEMRAKETQMITKKLADQQREKNKKQVEQLSKLGAKMKAIRKEQDMIRTQALTMKKELVPLSFNFFHQALLDGVKKNGKYQIDGMPAAEKVTKLWEEYGLKFRDTYKREVTERKKIYNKLQEMRGNIRVLCRCRPLNQKELSKDGSVSVSFPSESELTVFTDTSTHSVAMTRTFEFDRVFAPDTKQPEVYEEVGPLITSVCDGYNVCIFAYGQTGSGKTHTMSGPPNDKGVNIRALESLFQIADERGPGIVYEIEVSVLEIYNETIRDLLADEKRSKTQKLDIKINPSGGVLVQDLTQIVVQKVQQVIQVLEFANKNRSTAATNMNEHSSRSHLVLQINVTGKSKESGEASIGKLTLIDLAGSERLAKSGAEGSRATEAKAINKSLSALGDVINSLHKKESHVPFRNSKLTHLLQDSLGGSSKTVMLVAINPAKDNVVETLSSLDFAKKCRSVVLGQAQKKTESAEVQNLKKRIQQLEQQLA